MPDPDPLLDQLIAQPMARQGHPLRSTEKPAAPDGLAFLRQLLGADSTLQDQQVAASQLRLGQLPSEVVGKIYGRKGDIELPSSLAVLQQMTGGY